MWGGAGPNGSAWLGGFLLAFTCTVFLFVFLVIPSDAGIPGIKGNLSFERDALEFWGRRDL
jgi:hypothetical protein